MKSMDAEIPIIRPNRRRIFLFGLLGGGITLGMTAIIVNKYVQQLMDTLYGEKVPNLEDGYTLFQQVSDDISIVAYKQQGQLLFWSFEQTKIVSSLPSQIGQNLLLWSPDNRYIWINGILDLEKQCRLTESPQEIIQETGAWSPDGNFIALTGKRNLAIYNVRLKTWQNISYLTNSSTTIRGVCWSPDSKQVALWKEDQLNNYLSLSIWDHSKLSLVIQKETKETGKQDARYNVAWSPDGKFITAFANSALHIYDVQKKYAYEKMSLNTNFIRMAWSPDGHYLAMCLSNEGFFTSFHSIDIWRFTENKREQIYSRRPEEPYAMRGLGWSKDGQKLHVLRSKSDSNGIYRSEITWR